MWSSRAGHALSLAASKSAPGSERRNLGPLDCFDRKHHTHTHTSHHMRGPCRGAASVPHPRTQPLRSKHTALKLSPSLPLSTHGLLCVGRVAGPSPQEASSTASIENKHKSIIKSLSNSLSTSPTLTSCTSRCRPCRRTARR